MVHKDRYTVYQKSLSVAQVPAVRVDLVTHADPEKLLDLIWAVDRYPETMPGSYIVEAGFFHSGDSLSTAWEIIDVPFLAPRYLQFDSVRKKDRIDWYRNDHINSVRPDALFSPVHFGSWSIRQEGDKTVLIYRVCTDPGGKIPVWIVEQANRYTIPKSLLELEASALKLD